VVIGIFSSGRVGGGVDAFDRALGARSRRSC
jgi:hypothetical protein